MIHWLELVLRSLGPSTSSYLWNIWKEVALCCLLILPADVNNVGQSAVVPELIVQINLISISIVGAPQVVERGGLTSPHRYCCGSSRSDWVTEQVYPLCADRKVKLTAGCWQRQSWTSQLLWRLRAPYNLSFLNSFLIEISQYTRYIYSPSNRNKTENLQKSVKHNLFFLVSCLFKNKVIELMLWPTHQPVNLPILTAFQKSSQ